MAKNKLSSWAFKFLLNLYPPFFFGRIRIKRVSKDYKEIDVRVRKSIWNKNLASTIFGGTIFSAADPFYPLMYWQSFAHKYNEHVYVWLKSAEIQYLKPADSSLLLRFRISEEDIEAAYTSLRERGKHNAHHEVLAYNQENVLCARVKIVAYIGERQL